MTNKSESDLLEVASEGRHSSRETSVSITSVSSCLSPVAEINESKRKVKKNI